LARGAFAFGLGGLWDRTANSTDPYI